MADVTIRFQGDDETKSTFNVLQRRLKDLGRSTQGLSRTRKQSEADVTRFQLAQLRQVANARRKADDSQKRALRDAVTFRKTQIREQTRAAERAQRAESRALRDAIAFRRNLRRQEAREAQRLAREQQQRNQAIFGVFRSAGGFALASAGVNIANFASDFARSTIQVATDTQTVRSTLRQFTDDVDTTFKRLAFESRRLVNIDLQTITQQFVQLRAGGAEAEEAITIIRGFSKSLSELGVTSAEVSRFMGQLRQSFAANAIEGDDVKTLIEVMPTFLARASQSLGVQVESWKDLQDAIDGTGQTVREFYVALGRQQDLTSAGGDLNTFRAQWELLREEIQRLQRDLGERFLPLLTRAVSRIRGLLSDDIGGLDLRVELPSVPDLQKSQIALRNTQREIASVNAEITTIETERGDSFENVLKDARALIPELIKQRSELSASAFAARGRREDLRQQINAQILFARELETLQKRRNDLFDQELKIQERITRQQTGPVRPTGEGIPSMVSPPEVRFPNRPETSGVSQRALSEVGPQVSQDFRALLDLQAALIDVVAPEEIQRGVDEFLRDQVQAVRQAEQEKRDAYQRTFDYYRGLIQGERDALIAAEEGNVSRLQDRLRDTLGTSSLTVSDFDQVANRLKDAIREQSRLRLEAAEGDRAAQIRIENSRDAAIRQIEQQRYDFIQGLSDSAFERLSSQANQSISNYQRAIDAYNRIRRSVIERDERAILRSNMRIARSVASTVSSLLGQLVEGQQSFQSFVRGVLSSIAKLVAREAILRLVSSVLSPQGAAAGAATSTGGGLLRGILNSVVGSSFHRTRNDMTSRNAGFFAARNQLLASPQAFGIQSGQDIVNEYNLGFQRGLASASEQGGGESVERPIVVKAFFQVGENQIREMRDFEIELIDENRI